MEEADALLGGGVGSGGSGCSSCRLVEGGWRDVDAPWLDDWRRGRGGGAGLEVVGRRGLLGPGSSAAGDIEASLGGLDGGGEGKEVLVLSLPRVSDEGGRVSTVGEGGLDDGGEGYCRPA